MIRNAESPQRQIWQDRDKDIQRRAVEFTVELQGIWQRARPETRWKSENGQPEYGPVFRDPAQHFSVFALPEAVWSPKEVGEIKVFDMGPGECDSFCPSARLQGGEQLTSVTLLQVQTARIQVGPSPLAAVSRSIR